MKNYFFGENKTLYFIISLLLMLLMLVFFFHLSSYQSQKVSETSNFDATPYPSFNQSSINKVSVMGPQQDYKITYQWEVEGWHLNCTIKPLLNSQEKGKVVFKIKINEQGKLVALEALSHRSTLSEESIQSFKTTLELELESCLEKKSNQKIELISTGEVTFFVN